MRCGESADRPRRNPLRGLLRALRHEQLFWDRHRRQNIARFPPQERGTPREMPIQSQELYVVWSLGQQAVAPEDVQELRAESSAGV